MMMNNLNIIDGNNMAHRAYHSYSGLSYKGKSVAVIFGMIYLIKSLLIRFKAHKVIVVWDGKKHARRLELCPEYKGKRNKDGSFDYEDFNRQKTYVQRMLRALGITQVWNISMEADDYIYWLTRKYRKKYNIRIISNDKDFHQLLRKGITQVCKKQNDDEQELTPRDIKRMFGISVKQHAEYLMLLGDTSDNIKGFPGMGEKRVPEFLQAHGSIQAYLDDTTKGKIDKVKLLEVYTRNKELIDLKEFHNNNLKGKVVITYLFDKPNPKINPDKFMDLCKKYNFKLFAKESFINYFRL